MRIAVTYENGNIFQHFGHTEQFKIYDIENGIITNSQIIGTNGAGHGAIAGFLKNLSVNVLICGGIGGGAVTAVGNAGITLFAGNSGSADNAVNAFIAGSLVQNINASCNHHDENHSCGSHTCG